MIRQLTCRFRNNLLMITLLGKRTREHDIRRAKIPFPVKAQCLQYSLNYDKSSKEKINKTERNIIFSVFNISFIRNIPLWNDILSALKFNFKALI